MNHQTLPLAPWQDSFICRYQLPKHYIEQVAPIVANIVSLYAQVCNDTPWLLAINGAQGTGKSTLSAYLAEYFLHQHNQKTLVVSLDDYYLSPSERADKAQRVHPLFKTRGVPGTHDIKQAISDIHALVAGDECVIPRFDKSRDCPKPRSQWQHVTDKQHIVIVEGWCMGVTAQTNEQLQQPVNQFEQLQDSDGQFRQLVNEELQADYQTFFALFSHYAYLKVSDFNDVFRWRCQQEHQLIAQTGRGMSDHDIAEFIQYFERLTLWAQSCLPSQADIIVQVDCAHHLHLMPAC
ncbi:D-glycerate 3-kinase [Pseudoalteromonas ulvae UL12]|uniref:Kinase n=1 Tax=Pseudoalteromonas ulvae TaxID=107327 RepID=A0A244CQK1_PSEDV|nr:hypothetical protein [Pseudoalteromonas ulvae]MBE0365373.1 D-glycerate 3-kinase [Pseudoalteromonas ulvae UL12]OUL57848.1 hypothetical protein B1199_12400 [Pseudoalteromonas ulvae]